MNHPIKPDERTHTEERPPVFKSWRGLYLLVLSNLILLIGIFYIVTRIFS